MTKTPARMVCLQLHAKILLNHSPFNWPSSVKSCFRRVIADWDAR